MLDVAFRDLFKKSIFGVLDDTFRDLFRKSDLTRIKSGNEEVRLISSVEEVANGLPVDCTEVKLVLKLDKLVDDAAVVGVR